MKIKQINFHSLRRGSAPETHAHLHELHYFYVGRGIFYNGGQACLFTGPTLFYTPPGVAHHVRVEPSCKMLRFYCTFFTWPRAPRALRERMLKRFQNGGQMSAGTYLPLFEDLKRRVESGSWFLAESAHYRLHSLLCELCADQPELKAEYSNPYVAKAVSILKTMTYESLNVGDLARQLDLNLSYFIRLFGRHTGTTPARFLNNEKIETAAWLLQNTDERIDKIAEDLRFYDEFHFSKAFKRLKGVSPRAFREQKR